MDCFVRMPRSKARHKVDGMWALKWKKVRKEVNGKSTWVRIIKARLTARGFNDAQAFEKISRPMQALQHNSLSEL